MMEKAVAASDFDAIYMLGHEFSENDVMCARVYGS